MILAKRSSIILTLLLIYMILLSQNNVYAQTPVPLGKVVETGLDDGFNKVKTIEKNNPHYEWDLGRFYVDDYYDVSVDFDGTITFYKEKNQPIKLNFYLAQDQTDLTGNKKIRINDDANGFDKEFEVEKMDFGHGALFIRRTDLLTKEKDTTLTYLNFLKDYEKGKVIPVGISKEGNYEIALDYEIEEKSGLFDAFKTYRNYKIPFSFKVINVPDEYTERGKRPKEIVKTIKYGAADREYMLTVSSSVFQKAAYKGHQEFVDDGSSHISFQFKTHKLNVFITERDTQSEDLTFGDGVSFSAFLEKAIDKIESVENESGYRINDYPSQGIRMRGMINDDSINIDACAAWTDHFIAVFIVTAKNELDKDNDETSILPKDIFNSIDINEEKYDNYTYNERLASRSKSSTILPGNVLSAKQLMDDELVIMTIEPFKHGFAAERATFLFEQFKGLFNGQHVELSGTHAGLNGPDITIISKDGHLTLIQSKYYKSADASIKACFDKNGVFRYYDSNGQPMKIEVPKDQYDDAVLLMEKYIREGKIKNVTDPSQAKEIVRAGIVTYKQAVNLAKAGTIESLVYDSAHGAVTAASSFGVSAVIELGMSIWSHKSPEEALRSSIVTGIQVGGGSFITTVLAGQLSKAGLNSLLVPSSEAIVGAIGPRAAANFVNIFRPAGFEIYGAAAMKSFAKMLRGNAIVGTVSFVVFSVPDVVDTFNGRISPKQLAKNAASSAGGIVAGYGGYLGGAAIGSAILPGPGTVVGGIIGGLAGGLGGSMGVDAIADMIAEDDAEEMLRIFQQEYSFLVSEYLINEDEGDQISRVLEPKVNGNMLKSMYASTDRKLFADNIILPVIENEVAKREFIALPSASETNGMIREIFEADYTEEANEE